MTTALGPGHVCVCVCVCLVVAFLCIIGYNCLKVGHDHSLGAGMCVGGCVCVCVCVCVFGGEGRP